MSDDVVKRLQGLEEAAEKRRNEFYAEYDKKAELYTSDVMGSAIWGRMLDDFVREKYQGKIILKVSPSGNKDEYISGKSPGRARDNINPYVSFSFHYGNHVLIDTFEHDEDTVWENQSSSHGDESYRRTNWSSHKFFGAYYKGFATFDSKFDLTQSHNGKFSTLKIETDYFFLNGFQPVLEKAISEAISQKLRV